MRIPDNEEILSTPPPLPPVLWYFVLLRPKCLAQYPKLQTTFHSVTADVSHLYKKTYKIIVLSFYIWAAEGRPKILDRMVAGTPCVLFARIFLSNAILFCCLLVIPLFYAFWEERCRQEGAGWLLSMNRQNWLPAITCRVRRRMWEVPKPGHYGTQSCVDICRFYCPFSEHNSRYLAVKTFSSIRLPFTSPVPGLSSCYVAVNRKDSLIHSAPVSKEQK